MPSVATLPEYSTVLAQVFSPDGQLYAAGTAAGDLAVWRTSVLAGRGERRHLVRWRPHAGSAQGDVHSLAATDNFLLTGGRGQVVAWRWEEVEGGPGEPAWAVQVPGRGEVTSMLVMAGGTGGRLVIATGDNNLYTVDLETRQVVSTLSGHTDYIHMVAGGREGEEAALVSAGEDGTVRLWDPRKGEETHCLTPADKPELARPHLGKHVSCVAVASDWVACGGGPRLGLWHLRTLSPSVTLPPVEVEAKTVAFHDDTLLCGGRKVVYQTNFAGEVAAEVDVTCATTYSLVTQDSPKLLCVAGSSSSIDICTSNFNYRDATISFPVAAC